MIRVKMRSLMNNTGTNTRCIIDSVSAVSLTVAEYVVVYGVALSTWILPLTT